MRAGRHPPRPRVAAQGWSRRYRIQEARPSDGDSSRLCCCCARSRPYRRRRRATACPRCGSSQAPSSRRTRCGSALRLAAARRRLTVRIAEMDDRALYWLRLMHRPVPPQVHLARLPLAELRRAAEWRRRRAALLARQARNPPTSRAGAASRSTRPEPPSQGGTPPAATATSAGCVRPRLPAHLRRLALPQ